MRLDKKVASRGGAVAAVREEGKTMMALKRTKVEAALARKGIFIFF
jgi:hypothetical protein